MKKIVVLFIALASVLYLRAGGPYTYLTFETTDGAKVSVSASSLKLTISGTTLTTGSKSFTLTNLSRMYFSNTDETTTGISEITSDALDEATEIYDLNGRKIANGKSSNRKLPSGVYIVKTKDKTYKMTVK